MAEEVLRADRLGEDDVLPRDRAGALGHQAAGGLPGRGAARVEGEGAAHVADDDGRALGERHALDEAADGLDGALDAVLGDDALRVVDDVGLVDGVDAPRPGARGEDGEDADAAAEV